MKIHIHEGFMSAPRFSILNPSRGSLVSKAYFGHEFLPRVFRGFLTSFQEMLGFEDMAFPSPN